MILVEEGGQIEGGGKDKCTDYILRIHFNNVKQPYS